MLVVIGHHGDEVRGALRHLPISIVDNPDYLKGLSSSIRAGLSAVPDGSDGVAILLADMPRVRSSHIDLLISEFAAAGRGAICVPTYAGIRGNPVLWGAEFISDLRALTGDIGGRALLARYAERVREVKMPDDGVLMDVDRPADLAAMVAEPTP